MMLFLDAIAADEADRQKADAVNARAAYHMKGDDFMSFLKERFSR